MRSPIRVRLQDTFSLDHSENLPEILPTLPIEIRRLGSDSFSGGDLVAPKLQGRFQRFLDEGQIGLVALHEGEIVGFAWAMIADRRMVANGYFPLSRATALIHHCRVAEPFRGRRIYPALLCELTYQIRLVENVERIFIDSSWRNLPSLAGISRAGFHRLDRSLYVQVLGRRILALHIKARRNRP